MREIDRKRVWVWSCVCGHTCTKRKWSWSNLEKGSSKRSVTRVDDLSPFGGLFKACGDNLIGPFFYCLQSALAHHGQLFCWHWVTFYIHWATFYSNLLVTLAAAKWRTARDETMKSSKNDFSIFKKLKEISPNVGFVLLQQQLVGTRLTGE